MRVLQMIAALILVGPATSAQSQLSVAGKPYFGGSVTLSVSAPSDIGKPVLLAYGLIPLPLWAPLPSKFGPFYIGQLFNVLGLGSIGSNGRYDLSFGMPAYNPVLEGIPVVLQAFVAGDPQLSNPAALPLEQPYYEPADATLLASPNPTMAGLFGDRVATGDLNGDTAVDVIVGAWFEDAGGLDHSGRAYVFWGPTLTAVTTIEPPGPITFGLFGQGVLIADFDGDHIDDLVVCEGNGDPPPASASGHLYLYSGGPAFSAVPSAAIPSAGTGDPYQEFGHRSCVGDFSHDGVPDIAIGLPIYTVQGITKAGRVEIYLGPSLVGGPSVFAPDLGMNGFFGDHLTGGDVNGDSILDLVVGAPRKPIGGMPSMGRVYVFSGSTFLPFKTIDHPDPAGVNSRFGNDVVCSDLNQDGTDEIVATDQRNHAYVFWSPSLDSHLKVTRPPDPVTGNAASISFGYFAACGDVNGDGLDDVIVAEPFGGGTGRVHAALAPYFSCFLVLLDQVPQAGADFGWGVHMCDLDGDDRPELIVGSDLADPNGVSGAGHVTLFDFR